MQGYCNFAENLPENGTPEKRMKKIMTFFRNTLYRIEFLV
jgi:hypothetical protein